MTTALDIAAIDRAFRNRQDEFLKTLADLVRIPSVSWPSFDSRQVERSAQAVADLAQKLNVFDTVEILRGTIPETGETGQPAVVARRSSKNGAPTVLLYAHHDVQPPGIEADWDSPPFEPAVREGRIYGRGTADDKAGIASHLASLEILASLDDQLNLGLVLFVEGEEEFGSPSFEDFLQRYRDQLTADIIVVADSGNWSTSVPALTVSLRGNVTFDLTIRTLGHGVHSGMYGGAAPDALMTLARLVNSFYDDKGAVAVDGLKSQTRPVPSYDESVFRIEAGILAGVSLIGTGDLVHRLWSQPAITVTGIDAPAVARASNMLVPSSRARISVRVAPGQSASAALEAVRAHIARAIPFGAQFDIDDVNLGEPFLDDGTGPAAHIARKAMKDAWGADPVDMGVGGSIPFISSFREIFPNAEVLVTGVEDPDSRAHGTNESLDLEVFRHAVVAQSLLLHRLNTQTE